MKDFFEFDIPNGGMAFWLVLKKPYTWEAIATVARKNKLEIGEWQRYDLHKTGHNAIRLGFATYNEEETAILFEKLRVALEEVRAGIKEVRAPTLSYCHSVRPFDKVRNEID